MSLPCRVLLAPVAFLSLATPVIIAQPATAAPAAPAFVGTLPTHLSGSKIAVTGKYCPKYSSNSSSFTRQVKIPRAKANGSWLCTVRISNSTDGVNLKAAFTIYKVNNARLSMRVNITGHAYEVHYLGDGSTVSISATADSAYLSGFARRYMDDQGIQRFGSIPGKAFNTSGRWGMYTTTRYWSTANRRYETTTSFRYVTLGWRAGKVTSVSS